MLKEILLDPKKRPLVVDACVRLVDSEVQTKGGLAGLAVKAAYAVVKKIKPGMIKEAVNHLLDDFVARLDPHYADFKNQGDTDLVGFFCGRASKVATSLLGVTDERAARAQNRTVKKAYEKLRPTGQKHVEAAVPGIARVVAEFAD